MPHSDCSPSNSNGSGRNLLRNSSQSLSGWQLAAVILVCVAGCGRVPLPATKNSLGDAGRTNFFPWESRNLFVRKTVRMDSTRLTLGCGTPLCVGEQSYVLPLNNGAVAGIRFDSLAWVAGCAWTGDTSAVSGVAVDSLGFIFGTTRRSIFCLDPNGTPQWRYDCANTDPTDMLSPPLLLNGRLYVCNSLGGMWCLDANHAAPVAVRWHQTASTGMLLQLAGASNGSIVCVPTHGVFHATDSIKVLDASGAVQATWEVPGVRIVQGPIVRNDEITIAGVYDSSDSRRGIVCCYDLYGTRRWQRSIELLPAGLAVDNEGMVYVNGSVLQSVNAMGRIIQLDQAGTPRWFNSVEGLMPLSPVVTKHYEFVVAAFPGGRALYQFSRDGKIEEVENIPGEPAQPMIDVAGRVIIADAERAALYVMESDVVGKLH